MAAKFTDEIAAMKAAWDTATYSRKAGDEFKKISLSMTAEIMVDVDSYANFSLRAPTAAHFGITSIDILPDATLWLPSAKTAPTDQNGELLAINTDFAWESINKRRASGRKVRLKLPSPILKTRSDRTIVDDQGNSVRSDGANVKISWVDQHFPRIASKDYVAGFIIENCATRPTEIRYGSKRAFIKQADTTLPKPSELKPTGKQIEGRRGRKSG